MNKPNILLIMTDQHRLSALKAYDKHTVCQTPNIDRLAAQGVLFENTYTTCPVCTPARASVLTGEYPHKHGMKMNRDCHTLAAQRVRSRQDTLAHRLKKQGYRCGYNGKWHLGDRDLHITPDVTLPSHLPSDSGFEGYDYPGHGDGGQIFDDYKEYLRDNGWTDQVIHDIEIPTTSLPRWGRLAGPTESCIPYYITSNTIEMIDRFQAQDEPWFMWHNFWGPHEPHYTSKEYLDMYRDVSIAPWPNFELDTIDMDLPQAAKRHPEYERMKWEYYEELVRHYYAFTTMIDAQIGRLMDHLHETGLGDNTVIMFTADHGETLGSHAGLGDKGWHHFEEIQRIPFIARLPQAYYRGDVQPGHRFDQLMSLADVFPSILDLAGEEREQIGAQGESFIALVEKEDSLWRDCVVTQFWGLGNVPTNMLSIRYKGYKYGWNGAGGNELYDLTNDPYELKNIIGLAEFHEIKQMMRDKLLDWMDENDMQPRGFKHYFTMTSR